jgi:hypothetical protein
VAGETASTSERLRRAGAEAFESWLGALGGRLEAEGVPAPRARELALSTVMLLEGGFLLSRSLRSTVPLRVARDTALHELRSATDPDSEVVT